MMYEDVSEVGNWLSKKIYLHHKMMNRHHLQHQLPVSKSLVTRLFKNIYCTNQHSSVVGEARAGGLQLESHQ